MSKQPPTAPVPSAVGPCLNTIKIKALKASASEGRNFYKGVKKKKKKKKIHSHFSIFPILSLLEFKFSYQPN